MGGCKRKPEAQWLRPVLEPGLGNLKVSPGLAVWTAVCSSTGLSQRPAEQESQPGATPRGLRRDWLQERDGLQEGDGPQLEPRARSQG